ncbi:hypothetical protein HpMS172_09520 [Helicobacter pylori]
MELSFCDKNGAYNIELVSNDDDFGEVLDIVKGAFDDDLLQLLINKQNEFYFHKRIINNGLPFGIIKLPDMKEMCVNQWYINIFGNMLIYFINEGSYIIEGIKQEFYHSINKP